MVFMIFSFRIATDVFSPPNGPRISRRRVTRHPQQELKRRKTKAGNNKTLDQAVGCMRWLGGLLATPPTTPISRQAPLSRTHWLSWPIYRWS